MHEKFANSPDVAFLVVQTVFEGFSVNTAHKARSVAKELSPGIPVGHDAGPTEQGSVTMRRYRSGGTPWTVIVGPDGVVRANAFNIPAAKAIALIEGLRPLQSLPADEVSPVRVAPAAARGSSP